MKVDFIDRYGSTAHWTVCDIQFDGLTHTCAIEKDGKSSNGALELRALRGAMAKLDEYLADAEREYSQL